MLALGASASMADDIRWQAGPGNWLTAANWTDLSQVDAQGHHPNIVPGAADLSSITNGGYAQITNNAVSHQITLDSGSQVVLSSGALTVYGGNEYIGWNSSASFVQTDGTHTLNGDVGISPVILGFSAGSSGTYTLSGGSLNTTAQNNFYGQIVGWSGVGTFIQNGGLNNAQNLAVGFQSDTGASGIYRLSGGTLACVEEHIGDLGGMGTIVQEAGTHTTSRAWFGTRGGTGVMMHSGGTLAASDFLSVARDAGSNASYSLSNTAGLTSATEYIGSDGIGQFTQTGGSNNAGTLEIGAATTAGASGTYQLSSGTLSTINNAYVGYLGHGTMNQTGGNFSVGADYPIGTVQGSTGAYSLSGLGTLNVVNQEYVGYHGNGSVNQSGGSHSVNRDLALATFPGTTGSFDLSGDAQLEVFQSEHTGWQGTGTFHQTGTSSNHVHVDMNVSASSTAVGNFQLDGGSLTIDGNEYVGKAGNGTLIQTAGTHTIGGTLTIASNQGASGHFALNGGTLAARSILINAGGTFENSAALLLSGSGSSTAVTSTGGSFSQASTGTLNITLGGSGNGQFGQIVVGSASLAGTLNVIPNPAYTPAVGNHFRILRARTTSGLSGTFSAVNVPSGYRVTYFTDTSLNESGVEIVFGPLPGLKYFGIGVDWAATNPSLGRQAVRGDLDADNLGNRLNADISTYSYGLSIHVDATRTAVQNLQSIAQAFAGFRSSVAPGDTVIFFVSTHGDEYVYPPSIHDVELLVSPVPLIDGSNGITATWLASQLNSLDVTTRKIVILDACHAGQVGARLLSLVPNVAILSAATANTTADADPLNGSGVFTNSLIYLLDHHVFDLDAIRAQIAGATLVRYPGLIGQTLYLKDSGTEVFTGLQPQLDRSGDFHGNLAPACPADLGAQGGVPGQDGILDNNDFIIFISYFFIHDSRADVGRQGGIPGPDGLFDNNDFIVYINEFFAGC
jgi:hypothetical protein